MASNPKHPILFAPVPVRLRHDGWTAQRQIAFIEKLTGCGGVGPEFNSKRGGLSRVRAGSRAR